MSVPEPTATGTLEKTPLAHVLLTVLHRRLDGTLAIWPDDGGSGQDRVLFEKGYPVAARLLQPAASLERGLLPLFLRAKAPYAFYPADLVGDAVTVRGRADPHALIAASLRGGAREDVIDHVLARFGDAKLRIKRGSQLGRFAFVPKELAFIDLLRAEPQSVAELVQRAGSAKVARRTLYLLAITQVLEVFEGDFAKRSLTEVAHEAGDRFGEVAKTIEEEAQRRASRPPPAAETPAAAPDFSDLPGLDSEPPPRPTPAPRPQQPSARASRPAVSRPPAAKSSFDVEPPPEPPASLSSELRARWKEVADFAVAIDTMTYFQMLGIDTAASPDAVREAYFAQVKKWHPDRLPPELQALRPWADTIFHHLTEAHKTLVDTEERGKYLKAVQGGGGTPKEERKLAAILNAAMEFQKAEVLIRRKDWDGALRIVQEVLQLVPEEADYHATRGLILFKKHGTDAPAVREQILTCLDRALELDERNERALMTKAQLLQREGKTKSALELYEKIAEINPKNLEAQRQVRLARMRSQSQRPPPPSGGKKKSDEGLLSKLFGKKK